MAIVTSQILPFTKETLDLENPSRWNILFPLIRPMVKSFQTPKGQNILIDTSKARGKRYLHIVAVGNIGNFSSKLLDDKHVTAIITEKFGAGFLTAEDLPNILENAGVEVGHGVVMVRAGTKREVKMVKTDLLEIETEGELVADHVLHLLGTARGNTRSQAHVMGEMVKGFVKGVKTGTISFHDQKVDGKAAVADAEGIAVGFEKAKEVVHRQVERILKNLGKPERDVVYSVHYSDTNGLSRLENYIVAGEIAVLFDSKSLPYTLSHSTILNHIQPSRGLSISICPVPAIHLEASPKPKPHTAASTTKHPISSTPLVSSKISFNDTQVRTSIQNGCNALISAEPTITNYDTIVGDGDCGYTLRDGAKKVLDFISDKNLSQLPSVLASLVEELEINMGGTSGALYCIFLTALSNSLGSSNSIPEALKGALAELCKYTNARVGDRTMMDALIPFIDNLNRGVEGALEKAKEGVEGTKRMEAKLGRSTYLDESATRGVPDPGAYGLLVLFEGMAKGF